MAATIGARSSLAVGATQSPFRPGTLYVDGNYQYQFNAWCSVAGVAIAFRSRFVRAEDRQIVDSGDVLTPTSDRLPTTRILPLGIGNPLNVDLFALTGAPQGGQCFVQVQLLRGVGAAATVIGTIAQGYVTATRALAWPGSPLSDPTDGQGAILSYRQVFAPGADVSFQVPTNARWAVTSFHGNLGTSAAAPTRRVSLVFNDLVQQYVRSPIAVAQAGGTGFDYTWMTGFGQQVTDGLNRVAASLPAPSPMLAGYQAGTDTVNLDVADHWTLVDLAVQEWIDV